MPSLMMRRGANVLCVLVASLLAALAQVSPINSPIIASQLLQGSEFVGAPTIGKHLRPKVVYQPNSLLLHGDAGNTGSTDESGPSGAAPVNGSAANTGLGVMWWKNGTLTDIVREQPPTATSRSGIGAYDPTNFELLADWYPAGVGETVNPVYGQFRIADSVIVISSSLHRVYTVLRMDNNGGPKFQQLRAIDVSHKLGLGEGLLAVQFDADGNIWFTSGELASIPGSTAASSTTIGYITPSDDIYTTHIPSQIIENGFAVSGSNVFVVTGPPRNSSSSVGSMLALSANIQDKSLNVLWNVTVDGGSKIKPGCSARGPGSTPSLIGDKYVAITDNADDQINILILNQGNVGPGYDQIACKIPIFEKGGGANDNRVTTHFDGENYTVAIQNAFNGPPILYGNATNGANNSMSDMPGGVTLIEVTPSSGCKV